MLNFLFLMMICVNCGKETSDEFQGLCLTCYIISKKFFTPPSKVVIEKCVHCGSYRTNGVWQRKEFSPRVILEDTLIIDPQVTTPCFEVEMGDTQWRVRCQGEVHGKDITEDYTLLAQIHRSVCPRCSMIRGGYYEAVIQVRGTRRSLTQGEKDAVIQLVTEKLSLTSDEKAFLSKIDEPAGGIDFYLGGTHIAGSLARLLKQRFHGRAKKSVTLVGMKDGQKSYRVTHLVRFPRCHIGDILDLKGTLFQVTDLKTRVQVYNLATGDQQTFSYEEIDTADVLSPPVKTAIVISESDKEVQLLDPDTYKTIEVVKPRGYKGGSEETKIITWDTRVYLLPQE